MLRPRLLARRHSGAAGVAGVQVDRVDAATAALETRSYRMLGNRKEPWGQTVSRFVSPEGLLVGVTFTPSMRGL